MGGSGRDPASGGDTAAAALSADPAAREVLDEMNALRKAGAFQPEEMESPQESNAYIRRLQKKISTDITLIVARACNLGCKYCYAEGGSFGRKPALMSPETARRAVDYAFRRSAGASQIGIVFFGGEPLLNFPVIKDVVEYSQKRGKAEGKKIFYSMTTNGTLLSEEAIDLICRHRFGLKVSMDGPQAVQDLMRPFKDGRGSYGVVAGNLKKLIKRRGSLSVRATVTNRFLDVNALAAFFEDFGFTRIGFGYSTGTCFEKDQFHLGDEEMESLFAADEKTVDILFEKLSSGKRVRYDPFSGLLETIHNREKTRMRCGLARGCSSVDVDGTIYPCHRYVGMENYAIGDLDTGIVPEKAFDVIRDYYEVKRFCWKTCWARSICGGPCPWYVAHPDGHHRAPDKTHCDFIRRNFEFGIWLYDELRKRHPKYLATVVQG